MFRRGADENVIESTLGRGVVQDELDADSSQMP